MKREAQKGLFGISQVSNVRLLGNSAHVQFVVKFLPDTLRHIMID